MCVHFYVKILSESCSSVFSFILGPLDSIRRSCLLDRKANTGSVALVYILRNKLSRMGSGTKRSLVALHCTVQMYDTSTVLIQKLLIRYEKKV